ncbi:MAG: endopeptidase La [Christensenellaceae bacterium]|jgi:ATP-dependent Lon protease
MNQQKTFPMVPLRGMVIFPNTVTNFEVGRETSIAALDKAMEEDARIFLVAQKNPRIDMPTKEDIYEVGTVCKIRYVLRVPGGLVRVLVEGLYRARLIDCDTEPYFSAVVENVEQTLSNDPETLAYMRYLVTQYEEYGALAGTISHEAVVAMMDITAPEKLADTIAVSILRRTEEKQEVLEILNVRSRLEKVITFIEREKNVAMLENEIANKTRQRLEQSQREHYLREQMRSIQSALGEEDEIQEEIDGYRAFVEKMDVAAESKEKLLKELSRMERMSPQSPDYNVLQTYFEWIAALPFGVYTEDNMDIAHAARTLDKDHYGMKKVKERVLEHLSVLQLTGKIQGNILCFIGPPGVGKTSIARSIAEAVGRKFVRMSLGGVRDEAEIRGHRRTYIGAIPGRIISNMRRAGSMNPVFLLDEIDKMSHDFRGDPASAMLEVLDESVNKTFQDHYLDIDFDLSNVMFIATANNAEEIPVPLYDRMEIIELDSYTAYEKEQIAVRHLIPKQLEKHSLTNKMLRISSGALREVIQSYTIESGVRTLERMIGTICRKAAYQYVETGKPVSVTKRNLETYLGKPKYQEMKISKKGSVGVAIGLAWTAAGGSTLPIEVSAVDGSGNIELTGHLGDVMKESAKIAISLIGARAKKLGIDEKFYKEKDIHIHVPEGAIPKDGPSAGITMALAVASALSHRKVKEDLAMTGEVTLTGRVLAIGGLREKVFAAYRAGIHYIIIPKTNLADLDEIPEEIRATITFHPVEEVSEVFSFGLQ